MAVRTVSKPIEITDPPIATKIFGSTRWAWLWLIVRLILGYDWFSHGLDKLTNAAWMSGDALKGFWTSAILVPDAPARPAIAFGWYRSFIEFLLSSESYTWFAKLVAVGEFLVGVALILGLFTGVAAFFGGFMNWNFMMAGTASTNPLLFVVAVLLVLAWKIAGWWGLDRWLLPALGTPWRPGQLFTKRE